jgi:hypothetical protein
MPLDPTENLAPRLATKPITRRRLLGAFTLGAGSSGLLAACSTGTSRDAQRGRERDAERTSVVDNLQATRTAELVLGTPPSTPVADP